MKTTYTMACGCCESSLKLSAVTITIDDEKLSDDGQPSWAGVCETCGPRLMIPEAVYADLLAQHEAAVRVPGARSVDTGFGAEIKAACEAYDADAAKHGNAYCSTLAMLAAFEAAAEVRRASVPAKLDLSALRIGYELGKVAAGSHGR